MSSASLTLVLDPPGDTQPNYRLCFLHCGCVSGSFFCQLDAVFVLEGHTFSILDSNVGSQIATCQARLVVASPDQR